MKTIKIEIRLADNKIASGWKTTGLKNDNLEDQLLILGVIENFKDLVKSRVTTLIDKKT